MVCASPLDLMLVVDVSGSMGEERVAAVKHFLLRELIPGFLKQNQLGVETLAKLGVVTFADSADIV